MAIFTRHAKVVHPDGSAVRVREVLKLINQALGEALEGDFDADTRWAIAWFASYGFGAGEFGVAEVLAKAKNTRISVLAGARVLESRGGRVRLLEPSELPRKWVPSSAARPTVWETAHHLIRVYNEEGEEGAARMLNTIGSTDSSPRDLAYSVFLICERRKWPDMAFAYNALVRSWPEIVLQARQKPWLRESAQLELAGEEEA